MANSLCLRQSEFGPAGNFYSNFPQHEAQESAVIGRNKVLHSINIRNANAKLKLTPIVWDTVAVGAVEQQPPPPPTPPSSHPRPRLFLLLPATKTVELDYTRNSP